MLRYAKRAEARITYAVAWSPRVTAGQPIAASGWTIEPEEPGGLAIADAALDDRCARAAFVGGRAGKTYHVRNVVLLPDGGRASRALAIGVAR